MNTCPNCQQPMREGTVFCPHCGFRLQAQIQRGKLLTGSHTGDVILSLIVHALLIYLLNTAALSIFPQLAGITVLLVPFLSAILYGITAGKLGYKSLGLGIWMTYVVGFVTIVAVFVIALGVCLIGGIPH